MFHHLKGDRIALERGLSAFHFQNCRSGSLQDLPVGVTGRGPRCFLPRFVISGKDNLACAYGLCQPRSAEQLSYRRRA